MPDIGTPPPHPPDVSAQMKPSAPQLGGPSPDMQSPMSQYAGMQPQVADIGMKVMQVEPLIQQLANQVPSLAPASDQLLAEMKSRMGAPALGLAALVGGMMSAPPSAGVPGVQPPAIPNAGPAAPGIGAAPPPPLATAPPMGPAAPPMATDATAMPPNPNGGAGGPIALPPPPPTMGLMDIAMQLEIQLPSIGADDPSLLPEIQFFVAKMREEVPKALSGDQETQMAALQQGNPAPTDSSLKQIPSLA